MRSISSLAARETASVLEHNLPGGGGGKREIEIQSEQLVVERPISSFSPLAKAKCVHIGTCIIRAYGTNCLYMAGARNETEEEEEEGGDIKGIG